MTVGADGLLPLPWLAPALELSSSQTGHAVLLHGGEGRGLFELSTTLAQAMLCADVRPGGAPCGRCDDCNWVRARSHPDLQIMLPEALALELGWPDVVDDESKGVNPSQQIRIKSARNALDWASRSASRSRSKVLLVHPASSMNTVAASALLKMLEEPPAHLKFILTTALRDHLMPTLLSRCQHVSLDLPARSQALQWLTAQGVNDAQVLLDAAGGEPLAARDLATRGIDAATWRGLPGMVRAGNAASMEGWSVPAAVNALGKICHDAMCVEAGAPTRYFEAGALPKGATWAALRQWSLWIDRMSRHADHTWAAPLAIAAMVSRARRVWPDDSTHRQRVVTLESR